MWYGVRQNLPIKTLIYNFLPSWWYRSYGITFGKSFVFDPHYRLDCTLKMDRLLAERFPRLSIGSADPVPRVVPPDFGNAATAAAAGCDVIYPADNYPWNRHLPIEQLRELCRPAGPEKIASAFPYNEIIKQVKTLNTELDTNVSPFLVPRGVLNDALLIMGNDFFTDLPDGSPPAVRLLDYCTSILEAVIDFDGRTGAGETIILTNCTVSLVGPRFYEDRLFHRDRSLYDSVRRVGLPFGIHHCGIVDPYLSLYRRFPKVDFMEIGWGSDVQKTLETFPEAVVRFIFSAHFLLSSSAAEITSVTEGLLETVPEKDLGRFELSVPDIEYGTDDENICAVYHACLQCANGTKEERMRYGGNRKKTKAGRL